MGARKKERQPDARRKAAKSSRPRSKKAGRRASKGRSEKDKDRTQAKKVAVEHEVAKQAVKTAESSYSSSSGDTESS